ncbi:MAG: SUMF1/EgtB/PvdO family nonheme iron enzyme [Planctomycetia bacterium]|nr:SUMF1/EgtB/PvdO family nonheme iron enzyme [Planctomycetia bacterium]
MKIALYCLVCFLLFPLFSPQVVAQRGGHTRPGERVVLNVNGVAYAWRFCPPKSATGRDSNDVRGFWLLETEVTLDMFGDFVRETGYHTDAQRGDGGWGWSEPMQDFAQDRAFSWEDFGLPQSKNHPVANVSWNDAVAFCAWLGRKIEKEVGLPKAEQWEHACQAGTESEFYWGSDPESAVQFENVADASLAQIFPDWATICADDGVAFAAPVASYRPNAWGLFDMHGNVREWCAASAIRGGSWFSRPHTSATGFRTSPAPNETNYDLGFRPIAIGLETHIAP